MDGKLHDSYVRNNVFLDSFNRGTTLHGVQYLRVIGNVYYNCKGHTVFAEDGIETKNRIEHNLVIKTEPSFSLLNTDSTPACFWLTNPDNILVGNVCAGSEHYGFWYDLVPFPTGPSATRSICPINAKLGEFRDNVAHSLEHYGLRVFHGHNPRTYPCDSISFDKNNQTDPYHKNPLIQAYYEDFVGYKCKRNGVIGGNFGAVTLRRIAAVDNGLAGIEIEKVVSVHDGVGRLEDSFVVGRSENWDGSGKNPHGVITPRTDFWTVSDVRFYNFDWARAAAIGTCSHCYFEPSTDSDARTVKLQQLSFTNVNMRVRYQYPFKGILLDQDGTLTGLGSKTWATAYWEHNALVPECQTNREVYDGLLCDSSVQVRRVAIHGAKPGSLNKRPLYIKPYDDSILAGFADQETLEAYEGNNTAGTKLDWLKYRNPMSHWTVPYVTGHRYYLRWADGLDFEQLFLTIIQKQWDPSDKDIEFEMPHYDLRKAVHVDAKPIGRIANNTIAMKRDANQDLAFGDNLIRNDTETRRINLIINGDNPDVAQVKLTGVRCTAEDGCEIQPPPDEDIEPESEYRYWSKLSDWDGRTELPKDDEEVTIPADWKMLYDLNVTDVPVLKMLEINGQLIFMEG